jgi:hypothetical protein
MCIESNQMDFPKIESSNSSRRVLATRVFPALVVWLFLLGPASAFGQYYMNRPLSGQEADLSIYGKDEWRRSHSHGHPRTIEGCRGSEGVPTASGSLHKTSDSSLTEVGSWLWGDCDGVALKDSFSFIGNGLYVHTLNIAQLDSPHIVGEYFIGLADVVVKDLAIRDSLLYVLTGKTLIVMNCTDPRVLVSISEIPVSNFAPWRLLLAGRYAYIGDFYGIAIVDIVDPRNPVLTGYANTGEYVRGYAATANPGKLYVGYQFANGIDIFDILDPAHPTYDTSIVTDLESWGLSIKDTLLLVAGQVFRAPRLPGLLKTYSISGPLPVQVGVDTFGLNQKPGFGLILDSARMIAYVNTEFNGIFSINVSNPAMPRTVGNVSHNPSLTFADGTAEGGIVATATGGGAWFVDATEPDSMKDASLFLTGGVPIGIVLKDQYAFVVASGVSVLNVSDPTHPIKVAGLLPTAGGPPGSIALYKEYLYLPVISQNPQAESLLVLDVTDPLHPRSVHTLEVEKMGYLVVDHDRLYVTIGDTGFTIFDLTDPTAPRRMGNYHMPPTGVVAPGPIAVHDSIVALDIPDGIAIVSVSNPNSPTQIALVPGGVFGTVIKDSLLFAITATDSVYFSVFSIAIPGSPRLIGSVHISLGGISVVNMDTSQSFVYIDGYSVDVSNPASPVVASSYSYNSYVDAIASRKEYTYFSDLLGVHILRNSLIATVRPTPNNETPSQVLLQQNYPNPFNSTTTISYSLSSSSHVKLRVYDILGRVVSIIMDGEAHPGIHTVAWEANDLTSGLYYYRLETSKGVITKTMLLIK